MVKYKSHELNKEITRACGRLIYELIPDDKKADLANIIGNEEYSYEASLDEVRFNIYKKNYDKALSIIESVIKKAESLGAFQDDTVSAYFTFGEPFEEVAYKINNESEKEIRRAPIPFSTSKVQMMGPCKFSSIIFDVVDKWQTLTIRSGSRRE